MRVAFCHPDLGLGGAERLIVDAAAELAGQGHVVEVWTAHHDPKRCFEETVDGSFRVRVRGGWLPRHVLGRGMAICAYIRCIYVAFCIAWAGRREGSYDAVVVDQVSAAIPPLLWLTSSQVLFYCHFPDLLLAVRGSLLKRLYRAPIDLVEEVTTGADPPAILPSHPSQCPLPPNPRMAHKVLVNSAYTARTFASTFRRLHARGIRPEVLHPAVRLPAASSVAPPPAPGPAATRAARAALRAVGPAASALPEGAPLFLSINRFERKKGIELAVHALALLRAGSGAGAGSCLVAAGGYDERLAENREYLQELRDAAKEKGLEAAVAFVPSFTDAQRSSLLAACRGLLYTPENEHFGIVPLEAMASCRPVVACASGGPLESIVDGETGFLREPDPADWADAMGQLLEPGVAEDMGRAARAHVEASFSRRAFGQKLEAVIKGMCSGAA